MSMMSVDEENTLLDDKTNDTSPVEVCINHPKPGIPLMMAVCLAMGNAADAVEIMCAGFIMTDMGDISSIDKQLLSSAVFMGMLIGGILCGYLSDILGRKPCLLYSLGLNAIAGLVSAIVPNITWLIICRVIGGLGIGGSVPVVFSLGAEIFPAAGRGRYLSIIASFWMVGAIFTAFTAWIMLGDNYSGDKIMSRSVVSWRHFAAVSALPAVSAFFLAYYRIPESPRFLIGKGRFVEASTVLFNLSGIEVDPAELDPRNQDRSESDAVYIMTGNRMPSNSTPNNNTTIFNRMHGSDYDDDSVPTQDLVANTATVNESETASPSRTRSIPSRIFLSLNSSYRTSINKPVASTLAVLFGEKLRSSTLVLMVIWFTLCFGTYGLSTWISTLFADVGMANPYADAFIFAMANLPGNIISILFVDVYGRRKLLAYGMVLAGVSVVGFALNIHNSVVVVLCASLFNAFSVIGWNSLDCLSVECFPTSVRTSAMGLLAATGRLGAVAAQFVNGSLEKNIPVLLFVTCGCTIFGGLISFALPYDNTGTPLIDSVGDLSATSSESRPTSVTANDHNYTGVRSK